MWALGFQKPRRDYDLGASGKQLGWLLSGSPAALKFPPASVTQGSLLPAPALLQSGHDYDLM